MDNKSPTVVVVRRLNVTERLRGGNLRSAAFVCVRLKEPRFCLELYSLPIEPHSREAFSAMQPLTTRAVSRQDFTTNN